jgi:hypothetical protein
MSSATHGSFKYQFIEEKSLNKNGITCSFDKNRFFRLLEMANCFETSSM